MWANGCVLQSNWANTIGIILWVESGSDLHVIKCRVPQDLVLTWCAYMTIAGATGVGLISIAEEPSILVGRSSHRLTPQCDLDWYHEFLSS